jgi:hypothetical protein
MLFKVSREPAKLLRNGWRRLSGGEPDAVVAIVGGR